MFTSSAWKFSSKGAQTVTPVSRSRLVPVLNFIQHWAIWARLMMSACRYILHWSSRWQQQVHVTGSIYLTALQTKMKPCHGSAWFDNEQCLWKEKEPQSRFYSHLTTDGCSHLTTVIVHTSQLMVVHTSPLMIVHILLLMVVHTSQLKIVHILLLMVVHTSPVMIVHTSPLMIVHTSPHLTTDGC